MSGPRDAAADRARALWSSGTYEHVAERLRPAAAALVAACDVAPGARVLDVAAGTGNVALEAAARGARTVALDLTPAMIAAGRARCAAAGARVDWVEGDARSLPSPRAPSTPPPRRSGRCSPPTPRASRPRWRGWCGPGARWPSPPGPPGGAAGALPALARSFAPVPPEGPPPEDWGRPEVARARLAPWGADLRAEEMALRWEFASVEAAVAELERSPALAFLRAALGADREAALRRELAALLRARGAVAGGRLRLDAGWLLTVGRRAG